MYRRSVDALLAYNQVTGKGWSTMETIISCSSLMYAYFLCLCLLLSSKEGYAFEERKFSGSHTHTIQLSSLFPSTTCQPSAQVHGKEASLKVSHKHGPCSQLNQEKANAPTRTEILLQDESRVKSIRARYSRTSGGSNVKVTDAATLPAKDGSTLGTGNYIVTVGLGTPTKQLTLIFDTGSDLTWTQCKPCARSCYPQKEPIFDPSQSSTYTNISCTSAVCRSLSSATGNSPGCSSSTCVYGIQYGDNSFSAGFLGSERLTLTPTDLFDEFYFGCGQNNKGLFGRAAGLLGLGRDNLSFVSQTARKYNKLFSYCLPSSASTTGFLTFGSSTSKSAAFTPLSTPKASPSFYGIDFTGISVGGRKLSISTSVFSNVGAIIDSGTVITRLPPAAYSALRSAFRQGMSKYPSAPALAILDTCYDLSKYESISVPKISFFFKGGVEVDLDITGILIANKPTQVCLALAANSDARDFAIFGNAQQQTFEVVYDVAGGKIGFAKGGCS